MAYAIPAKPSSYSPSGVAPGCRNYKRAYERPLMGRRVDVCVIHTNWAGGVGTIESHYNWSLANPGVNTFAHYQHDLDGDAAKMLDTNRRGIGNAGSSSYWSQFGLPNASYRALVFETADRGTRTDPAPTGSYFTDAQAASLARDIAYECVLHDIPPVLLPKPDGRGITGHCWPFPYPAFTTAAGKQCPGYRKRDQMVDLIIPWAAAIVNAWTQTAPPPKPPPPGDDMTYLFRILTGQQKGTVGIAGPSVRPVSREEIEPGGPLHGQPIWDVPAGSYSERWLSAAIKEYQTRVRV